MTSAQIGHNEDAIAVIGMSCRFPGASDTREFWSNLCAGADCIRRFSSEEARTDGADPDILLDRDFIGAAGVLEDAECFDPAFFGYSPREALAMDPQHRVFLECAWSALEDAGYVPDQLKGGVGVYSGATTSTYHLNCLLRNPQWRTAEASGEALYGNFAGFLATRVSYKLNLSGPSIAVQTACSTSLVAVHLACQGLLNLECDAALAGGVTVRLPQLGGYLYEEDGILSPDGVCRPFDENAAGTVFGNGVGAVLLKRLADAVADGDHIDAVILGSAINNDGANKIGFTAPSIDGQSQVIESALAFADVSADQVGFVEAHGTGTQLGDPIELKGLSKVFCRDRASGSTCALGSVKANLGHLDAAAGIASLIKTILVVKHGRIPPTPHFNSENSKLELENGPFFVNRSVVDWPIATETRIAGVSSFGFGGTNAHVVLSSWADESSRAEQTTPQILPLSAATESALSRAKVALSDALADRDNEENLSEIAFTLQTGRRAFPIRTAIVARDAEEAAALLVGPTSGLASGHAERTVLPAVFMFSGQGAQYAGMGAGIYQQNAVFRDAVDHCTEIVTPLLGLDLRELMFAKDQGRERASQELRNTSLAQPALFTIEYAMASWWKSLGVQPHAMIGHSIGEYVAACLAGIFTLDDALGLVVERGRLMQSMPAGAMLAVPLSASELVPQLPQELDLAAENATELCVVSGPETAIETFMRDLERRDISGSRLHTSHAFHSKMMDGILESFRETVEKTTLRAPNNRFVSNVTGEWISDAQACDPSYWVSQLRSTVQFSAGVTNLLADSSCALIEIGPGNSLTSLARAHLDPNLRHRAISSMCRWNDDRDDLEQALRAAGEYWVSGGRVDWDVLHTESRRRVSLPTYSFERTKFNVQPDYDSGAGSAQLLRKRADIDNWTYVPGWRRTAPSPTPDGQIANTWLLFTEDDELGARLEAIIRSRIEVARIVTVVPGDAYNKMGADKYTLPPGDKPRLQRLWEDAFSNSGPPAQIVYLWQTDTDALPFESGSVLERAVQERFNVAYMTPLYLAQCLEADSGEERTRMTVGTSNAFSVLGSETNAPYRTPALGLFRVLECESDTLRCRFVDLGIASPADEKELAVWADQLYCECLDESENLAVAYRGSHRWQSDFAPLRLTGTRSEGTPFKKDGVYLITGGLGGIGRVIAEYLARNYSAKLILTSRRAIVEDTESGEAGVTQDPQLKALQELEKAGAEVLTIRADAADLTEMRHLIVEINERFGSIDGVIHAAGVSDGGMIALRDHESSWDVFRPKLLGAEILLHILSHQAPDFILLCSSLNAVVGVPGTADYTAANSYLDALAQAASGNGRTDVMSVNWDRWVGIGMAEGDPAAGRGTQSPIDIGEGLSTDEGLEILQRAICSRQAQVIVSTRDLPTLFKYNQLVEQEPRFEDVDQHATGQSNTGRDNLSSDYAEPESDVQRQLQSLWQTVLGVAPIGIDDNFIELGGDSLLALRLASRIRRVFSVQAGPRLILEAGTVRQTAIALELESIIASSLPDDQSEDLKSKIDAMSAEEVRALLAEKRAESAGRTDTASDLAATQATG